MQEATARAKLETEGFSQIYVHKDGSGFSYPEHDHPVHTAHIILNGSMTIEQEGKVYELKPGDRFDFPRGVLHIAKMGPEGCKFITGIRV